MKILAKDITKLSKLLKPYNNIRNIDELNLLINLISPPVYEYIADFTTYDEAISKLNELYIKPSNEIFTRHKLATRK